MRVFVSKQGQPLGHCGLLMRIDAATRPPGFVYARRLYLNQEVVRDIAQAGKAPYALFRGAVCDGVVYTMVWYEFELYHNGTPALLDFAAIPGDHGTPPPEWVSRISSWIRDRK